MGKYIIELKDKNVWSCGYPAKTLLLTDVSIFGTKLSSVNTGIELIPYIEPDTKAVSRDEVDKIYDEARERGYKEGQARGYQEGMYDMHEAVMKLIGDVEDDSFRSGCMVDLFACEHAMTVMTSCRPGEIIKKVKELEDRQKKVKELEDRQKALQKEADLGEVRDVLRTTAKECHVTFDEIAEVLSGMMGEKTDEQE